MKQWVLFAVVILSVSQSFAKTEVPIKCYASESDLSSARSLPLQLQSARALVYSGKRTLSVETDPNNETAFFIGAIDKESEMLEIDFISSKGVRIRVDGNPRFGTTNYDFKIISEINGLRVQALGTEKATLILAFSLNVPAVTVACLTVPTS
jgi:hypothetical protein